MVFLKKQLVVFGGFHDNLRDYKYFNDVYTFNIETYKWTKLEPTGTAPAPRSGCCMVALNDGRVLIYGGYSKERLKKDVDKGHVYNDAFLLTPDKNDTTDTKFKWVQIKMGGMHFPPRCSMPVVVAPNNLSAYFYGGVFDVEDDDENIAGNFFNDFYQLDLEKFVWKTVNITGKKQKTTKARRRKNKDEEDANNEEDDAEEMQIAVEEQTESMTISDDGIFKMTIGPVPTTSGDTCILSSEQIQYFQPSPRMNAGLAIKHGVLYLYGGMFEDGDKQVTFKDFYALDLKKLDEWRTLNADETAAMEWLGSDSEDSSGEDEESEEEEESGSEMDTA